jgi:hypothetical protein
MQHSQNLRETRVHDDRLGSNFLSHHEPMIRSGSRASISSTVTTRFLAANAWRGRRRCRCRRNLDELRNPFPRSADRPHSDTRVPAAFGVWICLGFRYTPVAPRSPCFRPLFHRAHRRPPASHRLIARTSRPASPTMRAASCKVSGGERVGWCTAGIGPTAPVSPHPGMVAPGCAAGAPTRSDRS